MRPPKQHILCVDDDDDICFMLSVLLGQAGYDVRRASGVTEGLRLVESESFDLYILDNRFADGTGLDLCRRIRELDPATPVVFFSGLAHESDGWQALDAGAQDYLIKPNDLHKLIDTIARLIGDNDREANSRPAPSAAAANMHRG